ncbi:hypothetical protein METBIDRAFT_73491 [Metschnikowia bicuspidata var. bicuspidata NRRL YB-4993]|uniref:Rho-GAP domain-containing protein n=1 Tax=Metschnikowia bicuspidata var. bicuspidata NRRL YB-4993 TaxID=869754 RepID=A0A1A0H6D5_9ASCO|nr:hypothetical protein METBIDRAFT_73491 [Metschnikowia bicuspidata var. bicuspidata NRRL YB-4993]OBA19467.1 hypothetical protein METBIDRAFT_73491 [Metschnikowia bicuspidata var. bicuspidata NRRL YB-4993]
MNSYACSFWSPDYISGIDRLSRHLLLSLGQLHELRKFVFNYMKYFHTNGEYLSNLAESSYPIDSSFRTSRGPRGGRVASGIRQASRSEDPLMYDMDYVFRQFVEKTRNDLLLHQRVASEIDRLVLEKITAFLKQHEPQIKIHVSDLADLFDEFRLSYEAVETIKREYTTIYRLGEFLLKQPEDQNISANLEAETDTPLPEPEDEDPSCASGDSLGTGFPLVITSDYLFTDTQSFTGFVAAVVKAVPITKRKIPLPGHRNEMFSSEQLCGIMTREKPRGFNPTRSNLEKLGQVLLDIKVLTGTGFFAKKFSSEGMWFEWSDMAIAMSRKNSNSTLKETPLITSPKLEDRWNSMAFSTTKKFNGVFKTMQNSLSMARFSEEDLENYEKKYNEAYVILQKQKHLLEMRILMASQYMEKFEKFKIELVYQSLTKLVQVLQTTNSQFATDLSKFCVMFVNKLNKPENYSLEFKKGLNTFGTGIYFPSLLAPDQPKNRHVSTSQLNTNFQNIKLNFNLFKDIPLQAKMYDIQPEFPLSLHSIPIFMFETIKSLDRFPPQKVRDAWSLPINYQQYWLMKDTLISEIQEFQEEISVVRSAELTLLLKAIRFLEDKDVSRLVNFLKNWLLEISDSIIPSTVHESLVATYKITRDGDEASTQRLAETLKILSAMPRSNLSSLIHILEHIAETFELDLLERSGNSDIVMEAVPSISESTLNKLASKLNSFGAIGTIPFLHLIMRPSVVKNAGGYHPPLEQYNMLLGDLLALSTRRKLFQALVASEEQFIKRQEQQKQNLGIPKIQEPRERSTSVNKQPIPQIGIRALISPNALNTESFELRPFRTGATPRPSPSASPVTKKPRD